MFRKTQRVVKGLILLVILISFFSLSHPLSSSNDIVISEEFSTITEEPKEQFPVYIPYMEEYMTIKYNCWENVPTNDGDKITVATSHAVIRRGTELEIYGDGEDSEIIPASDDMTELSIERENWGWIVDIPDHADVGRYTFITNNRGNQTEIDILVIFDPANMGIAEEKLRAYAYDEEGTRDENDYIYTTGHQAYEGTLRPFGDDRPGWVDMYEFALAAVAGSEDTQEAAVRLNRVVAQRNIASPSDFDQQPIIRDSSQILFGNGTTVIHQESYEYVGLTLEDAEILSQNGKTIPEIENYDQTEKSKLINGWCDETSWALTSLLRSIGIPARVASIHPAEGVELMGHFMVEVWLEESLYQKDWAENPGGWYVFDADEWNAEWYVEEPIFWMPLGECFTSRHNYRRVAEELFFDRYEFGHVIVMGEDGSLKDVSRYYLSEEEHEMNYGTLTKYKGRGAGDLYRVEVSVNSRLSLESSRHLNASIHVGKETYPTIPITTEGYPFQNPSLHIMDDEVILAPGEYYVGIYAPNNGLAELEGDYGIYTLTLEEAPDEEPDTIYDGEQIIPEGTYEPPISSRSYLIAFLLLSIWVVAYIGNKKS